MENMSFSVEPGGKTSCEECKKYFETKFKFCPECGVLITHEMRNGTFQDLLKKKIVLPKLIYDKPSRNEFCEFKLGQLLDKDGNFILQPCLSLRYTKNEAYMEIDDNTTAIHKKYTQRLDEYFININKHHLYQYTSRDGLSLNARLQSKQAMLILMKIKHTFTHLTSSLMETFGDLLIALIENNISNPVCGTRFMLVPDKNIHYYPSGYPDYWKDPANYIRDANKIIRFTLLDKMEILFDEQQKSMGEEFEMEMKEYDKIQENVDALLGKVHVDIYYSYRNKKIYQREELLKIFEMELKFLDFKLEERCTYFKIMHINVYILNKEVDELFYFGELRSKLTMISKEFGMDTKCQGVSPLLGLSI